MSWQEYRSAGSGDANGLTKKLAEGRANPLVSKLMEGKRPAYGSQGGSDSDRFHRPAPDSIQLKSEKIKLDLAISRYRAEGNRDKHEGGRLETCMSPKSQQKVAELIEKNTALEKLLARIQESDFLDQSGYDALKGEVLFASPTEKKTEDLMDEKTAFKLLDLERLKEEQEHLVQMEATLTTTLMNLRRDAGQLTESSTNRQMADHDQMVQTTPFS